MELHLAVDDVVLLGAGVMVVGVIMAGLAGRLHVPSLLVILIIGMVVADDGLGVVHFDDHELAQSVSVVALVLILFEGGLSTTWRDTRAVAAPALLLPPREWPSPRRSSRGSPTCCSMSRAAWCWPPPSSSSRGPSRWP